MRKHSKKLITELAQIPFQDFPDSRVKGWDGKSLVESKGFYHGKVDVTTIINFHEWASGCELTQSECDELINKVQKIADTKISEFLQSI